MTGFLGGVLVCCRRCLFIIVVVPVLQRVLQSSPCICKQCAQHHVEYHFTYFLKAPIYQLLKETYFILAGMVSIALVTIYKHAVILG